MGILLPKQDILYSNANFWWFYILSSRGFDEEQELNLDEAISEVIERDKVVPDFIIGTENFVQKKVLMNADITKNQM